MKVLYLVKYITILDEKVFKKNITGYGLMVRDIADTVSKTGIEIDLITSSAITKGRKYKSFTILKRTWTDIVLHMKPYYILKMARLIKKYNPSWKRAVKMLYYALSAGYVEYLLKSKKYDLVHIHGIEFGTQPYIECCERTGIKYIVTLHGLNSFSDSVLMESREKQFEKDFLQYAYKNKIPLSVISTGILNAIKKYLGIKGEIDHFYVVANGTDVTKKTDSLLDIREKYGIDNHKQIMLCVGNLSIRKNQVQIVRAYAMLPEPIKRCLCVLFLGKDTLNSEVNKAISEYGLEKELIVCGNINREEISAYYRQADYTILASISEGFGLSIIEGFVYGLPNLTYADLDAAEDLFDENAMHLVDERTDEALKEGIVQLLEKTWDKEFISGYANNFSYEKMANEYVKVYQDVANRYKVP